jgi:hypothetical protein
VTGFESTVGGGVSNSVNGQDSVITGGFSNSVSGSYSVVSGGRINRAAGDDADVGGGNTNMAWSHASTVGGGMLNNASGNFSVIGGGESNVATNVWDVVAGGNSNNASGDTSAVVGGWANAASGHNAFVGAGDHNTASGDHAFVDGGSNSVASGAFAGAAGLRAKATHAGSYVWADDSNFDFGDTTSDQFNVRATGGVRLVSAIDGNGNPTAGVSLAPGSGSWSSLSDRNAKTHFHAIDALDVLARVDDLNITEWSYKSQPGVTHVGPMAQDFRAAFGLGEDEKHIDVVDEEGVALAAIQGLDEKVTSQQATIDAQAEEIAAQQEMIAQLMERVTALEQKMDGGSS